MTFVDEEKHIHPIDGEGKELDTGLGRVNPHHAHLPELANGERRTSVSPDRATMYCDPTAPAALPGAAAQGMSQTRKYVLLAVFCMGVFIDGAVSFHSIFP